MRNLCGLKPLENEYVIACDRMKVLMHAHLEVKCI